MRVKFWGVRGSVPTPLSTEQLEEKLFRALSAAGAVNLSDPAEVRAFIATLPPSTRSVVGGNTTCVEINSGDDTIIVDCGTGMRRLGLSLMAYEFGRGQGTAHIFLTHAHWDHLQGFPFFNPAYVPGNKLIFYAVTHDPQYYLQHQQTAPTFFPIPPEQMRADISFIQLQEGEAVQVGPVQIFSHRYFHFLGGLVIETRQFMVPERPGKMAGCFKSPIDRAAGKCKNPVAFFPEVIGGKR